MNSTGRVFTITLSRVETYTSYATQTIELDEDDNDIIQEMAWKAYEEQYPECPILKEYINKLDDEHLYTLIISSKEFREIYEEAVSERVNEMVDTNDTDDGWQIDDLIDVEDNEVEEIEEDTSFAVLLNQPGTHNTEKLIEALVKEVAA